METLEAVTWIFKQTGFKVSLTLRESTQFGQPKWCHPGDVNKESGRRRFLFVLDRFDPLFDTISPSLQSLLSMINLGLKVGFSLKPCLGYQPSFHERRVLRAYWSEDDDGANQAGPLDIDQLLKTYLDKDLCIIDEDFLVRGLIHLRLLELLRLFAGVWGSASQENF